MKSKKVIVLVLFLTVFAAIPVLSQNPGGKPSFEVASVKATASGACIVSIANQPGGRFIATCMPLRGLIANAYHVRDFQIIGGPGWMASDRWSIEARAAEQSVPNTPELMALRLQSLLEERFQLKLRRETRELPTFALIVAKGGPKIKQSEDQSPPQENGDTKALVTVFRPGEPIPRGAMRKGIGEIEAHAIGLAELAQTLSAQLKRNVMDNTGLTGLYDIKLKWAPEIGQVRTPFGQPAESSGPSIFTAVQEQLGLKLESIKGPTEVLVIDSVQKPSEN
jgi:uncharacterized protein (TIGR03435 family)